MKLNTLNCFLLSLLLIISSCEGPHDIPPDSEGPAQYSVNAAVSYSQINLEAGKNAFGGSDYFYYETESVHSFYAFVEDTNKAGNGRFSFTINSSRQTAIDADINQELELSISPGTTYTYEYNSNILPGHVVNDWITEMKPWYSSNDYQQSNATFKILDAENIVHEGIFYRKATIQFDCFLGPPPTHQKFSGTATVAFRGEKL